MIQKLVARRQKNPSAVFWEQYLNIEALKLADILFMLFDKFTLFSDLVIQRCILNFQLALILTNFIISILNILNSSISFF